MAELWASGLLLKAVLVLTALELGALWLLHALSGRGLAPRDYALNLLSGLCLMGVTLAVLTHAAWFWAVACLAAAGGAHGADLWQRLRRPRA